MYKRQLWHDASSKAPTFSDTIELDLEAIVPSIAGPRRPQDRVSLSESRERYHDALASYRQEPGADDPSVRTVSGSGGTAVAERLEDGHVVIAAITSCTNTCLLYTSRCV